MISCKGKIALVTGANRGIGIAIAKTLLLCGAKVAGTATTKDGANIISNYLKFHNGKGFILDITNMLSIKKVLKDIRKELGDIDILINNAGIKHDKLIKHMKYKDWKFVIDTNLSSVFRLSKEVIPSMCKKKYGRIINIGSIIGSTGNIGQTNYAATKAGIMGFTKSLALEVASKGITVNVIAPGFIETEMTSRLKEKQRNDILKKIPVGRFGNTLDVANAVAFLASNESAYITGETIHINGGMYMI